MPAADVITIQSEMQQKSRVNLVVQSNTSDALQRAINSISELTCDNTNFSDCYIVGIVKGAQNYKTEK
jgi:hypothetical protein